MTLKKIFRLMIGVVTMAVAQSCVEEIDIQTDTFESVLVIEGTVTTENAIQEILLSRTLPLEEKEISPESNAKVMVTDDLGNEYLFEETFPGLYRSTDPFKAVPGRTYSLMVTTKEGKSYASDPSQVPVATAIENMYAERVSLNGDDGIAILVDLKGSENSSGYLKYNFEETYKIISPYSFPYDLIYEDGQFIEVKKTKEERVCYNTVGSDDIILANSTNESGNKLSGFPVRFIESTDPIIAQRYSILVRQLSISEEAFVYYETLKDFSGSDNLFSQIQPGFINGNVFSISDPGEKVVGFFTVAAMDEERVFFSFEDFYDKDETKGKFLECIVARPEVSNEALIETLGENLNSGRLKYLGYTLVPGGPNEGPYRVIDAACVDCTELGTNVKPDFWIED